MADCDKKQYEELFFSAKGQYDLYLLFTERGIVFLNEGGILSFINPIRFFNADYGRNAREFIVKNCHVCSILDVSQLDVFQGALTYPCVISYRKDKDRALAENAIAYRRLNSLGDLSGASGIKVTWLSQADILKDDEYRIFTSPKEIRKIINKIDEVGYVLGNVFSVARGLPNKNVDFRKESHIALKSKGALKYAIDGANVIRVGAEDVETFRSEMIIMPRTVKSIKATLKPEKMVLLDRIYYLEAFQKVDLKFALGVINSKLTNFWFEDAYATTKVAGGYFDLNGNQIKSIRLPKCDAAKETLIAGYVRDVLTAKKSDPNADTSALEAEIDQLVYKLYNLTPEEIAIVEGRGEAAKTSAAKDATEKAQAPRKVKQTKPSPKKRDDEWMD